MKTNWALVGMLAALTAGAIGGELESGAAVGKAPPRPNIVLIVADDMGYSDPGCFGGEIPTPNLDRLAQGGLRFSTFYNGGMCVVSRTELMSGRWHPRAGMGNRRGPWLSEALRDAGYRTMAVGKWHLAGQPLDHGFDRYYGFLGGGSDYFRQGKDYQLDRKPAPPAAKDFYTTAVFTDYAIEFLREARTKHATQPFFLYLSYNAPHNPLQARREEILPHRGRYRAGWQAIREARFARQIQQGIVPPGTRLPAYPQNLPDWNSLSEEQRDMEDLRMAVHAAAVSVMDAHIGRLLKELDDQGLTRNTLVLFSTDNGADPFSMADAALIKKGILPGEPNGNWQNGLGWAYACGTPFRLYKISQHNGGVCGGLIAHWPDGIAKPGGVVRDVTHMVDVLPTLAALAGPAAVKAASDGDGVDLRPLFAGRPLPQRPPLFFQFHDNRALMDGNWRMAEVDGGTWELYDIAKEPTESEDLAPTCPDEVKRLAKRWDAWWTAWNSKPYVSEPKTDSQHYGAQGDRGSGKPYVPSAMPAALKDRLPMPPE